MRVLLRNLALSALSLSVLTCGKKPASQQSKVQNVFGNDDRTKVTSTDYPWRTIVKIFSYNPSTNQWIGCTGTLVGPDLLLTAAQCLQDKKGNLNTNTRYYVNYIDGVSPFFVEADSVWLGTTNYENEWENDWALVRLNVPLGDSMGYMGVRSIPTPELVDLGATFTAVGYAGDFGDGKSASAHIGCSIFGEDLERFLSDCEVSRGASGGPVFGTFDGLPEIIGVVSGGETHEDGTYFPPGIPYSRSTTNLNTKASKFVDKYLELKDSTEGVTNNTVLTICNRSQTPTIRAAVAYKNGSWFTKGWTNIKQNTCENVNLGAYYSDEVRVYGDTGRFSDLKWGGGDMSFCVGTRDGFDSESNPENCFDHDDAYSANFGAPLIVQPRKVNNWTFN